MHAIIARVHSLSISCERNIGIAAMDSYRDEQNTDKGSKGYILLEDEVAYVLDVCR